jgi:hypothetical protein
VTGRIAFTGLLLAGILGLLTLATTLGPLAGLAPLWVLVPTSVLAALQLFRDVRAAPLAKAAADAGSPGTRRRQLRITLWLVGFAGSVFLFGFLPAASPFLFSFLRCETGTSVPRALTTTLVTIALVYVVFGVVGGIALPGGVLF